jgi:hypothetical protein
VPGTNPAVTPGAAPGGSYRLRVVLAGSPAAAEAAASNETALVLPRPRTGAGATAIVYRVYGPTPPAGPGGGVPLPALVRRLGKAGDAVAAPTCPLAEKDVGVSGLGGGRAVAALVSALPGPGLPPFQATPRPLFARPKPSALGGLFSGANNAYLAAFASFSTPGRLAVWVGASSASFPPTQDGAAIPPPRDVRYFSLCLYRYESPYPLIGGNAGCAADIQLRPDGTAGRWVVVSGPPEDRPSDGALAAAGAVWVPGADADRTVPVLALFRDILPRAGYGAAVQAVPADGSPASAAATMGAAYPAGFYCSKATFEAGGLAECLA